MHFIISAIRFSNLENLIFPYEIPIDRKDAIVTEILLI